MSDIAMCLWTDCLMKNKCWRYSAPRDKYQTYFIEPPIEDWKCEYFWEMENKKQDSIKKQ